MFINFLRSRRLTAVLLAFFLPLIPLSADSIKNNFHWALLGNIFHFAADNGTDSDPAPILPSLGFSLAWQFWGPLRVELTEDIYFTNYEYNHKRSYPMASNPENRSAFVLGFVTAIQLTGVIPLNDNGTNLRVYGGPAADFRIVTQAIGLHPNDSQGTITSNAHLQTEAIRDYFWSEGRWFMPVFGAGMDFPVNSRFLLGFDLRTWFPVYKLWTNDDTPAVDGWRFGIGLRITPRKKED